MALLRKKCREHSLRVTPQRVMIYKELLRSHDHPSSERIFARLQRAYPEVSFETVYRSLATFNQIGVVDLVEGYETAMRF